VWLGICGVRMLCGRVVREEDVDYVVLECIQCGVFWRALAAGSD
jgi:uncharacterized Zn finger protein